MSDQQWLNRVYLAYTVYKKEILYHERTLDDFMRYLFRQYGIVYPEDKNDEQNKHQR
jgi:hypothetical protein